MNNLSLLEGPLYGGRMEDFLGWSAGKTMLGGSFFALLLMLKEKSIGCFFSRRKGLFEWLGFVGREN